MTGVVYSYWLLRISRKDGDWPGKEVPDLQLKLAPLSVTFVGHSGDGVLTPTVWLANRTMEIHMNDVSKVDGVKVLLDNSGYQVECGLPGGLVWQGDWRAVAYYFRNAYQHNMLLDIVLTEDEYKRLQSSEARIELGKQLGVPGEALITQNWDNVMTLLLCRCGSCPS